MMSSLSMCEQVVDSQRITNNSSVDFSVQFLYSMAALVITEHISTLWRSITHHTSHRLSAVTTDTTPRFYTVSTNLLQLEQVEKNNLITNNKDCL